MSRAKTTEDEELRKARISASLTGVSKKSKENYTGISKEPLKEVERRKKISLAMKGNKRGKNHIVTQSHRQKLRECMLLRIEKGNVSQKMKDTNVEVFVESLLRNSGEDFIKQKRLKGTNFSVDFFIPSRNIAIECDGCYWHGCPEHYPDTTKQEKDLNKNKLLASLGYRIIRVWEHDIGKQIGI